MKHLLVAALAAGLVLGAAACGGSSSSSSAPTTTRTVAKRPALTIAPARVRRGGRVTVSGSAGDCPAGDSVTVSSRAFPHKREFAGQPALSAKVHGDGSFSTAARIPATTKPGTYDVTARCGGGNLGLLLYLTVTG